MTVPARQETIAAGNDYAAVAASTNAQALTRADGGQGGAVGDYLSHLLIVPAAAGCGVVTLLDGGTTVWTFPGGGTTALPTLAPIPVPVGAKSVNGAWKITTGANVAVMAIGNFT